MKRKLAVMLLAVMAVSMVACGKQNDTNNDGNVGTESGVTESTEALEDTTEVGNTAETDSSIETENNTEAENSTEATGTEQAGGALNIINSVWATYGEDEKFAVGGGDSANLSMEGPNTFDATNAEELDASLGFPAAEVDKIDDAASMMHMMNANNFTCGVYHVTDAANVQTVADAVKENIFNRQWICGFPEKLLVVSVDDYVVSAFGAGDLMELFKTKLNGVYENATILYEESL